MISTDAGVWIGALLTLSVYTFYIRDKPNIFYKIAESSIIGCALGYTIVIVMAQNLNNIAFSQITKGNVILIIPVLLGLMTYARFTTNYKYLARIPISIMVGTGISVGAYSLLSSSIFAKVIYPLPTYKFIGVDLYTVVISFISIASTVLCIWYFFFTGGKRIQNPPISYITRLGRITLMVYFGVFFGALIFARSSLLIGRIQFLLYTWLGGPW